MRPVVAVVLLLSLAFTKAERDLDSIVSIKLPDPPHLLLPHGIPVGSRIVGGREAVPHSHPYQVALFLPVSGGTAFCGGSLITSQTVLTAAHCVDSLTGPVEVILGAHNIRLVEATQESILSSDIIIHSGWSSALIRNDIALIILPDPVELTPEIQLIGLPNDDGNTYDGHQAVVSGWGRDSDESQSISSVLRDVEVPIITNSRCNVPYLGIIQPTNICASGLGGRSSCNGDSGGPLVVAGKQVGIVSFGIALGCEVGWPSAYTRVTSYLSWIKANSV